MKRIVLDHFRRWWLVLAAVLIADFAFQSISIRENNSQTSDDPSITAVHLMNNTIHNIFIMQAVM